MPLSVHWLSCTVAFLYIGFYLEFYIIVIYFVSFFLVQGPSGYEGAFSSGFGMGFKILQRTSVQSIRCRHTEANGEGNIWRNWHTSYATKGYLTYGGSCL